MTDTQILCDFCNMPDPAWEYPAGEIEMVPGLEVAFGSWCACDWCRTFIDHDDRESLARRALKQNPGLLSIPVIRLMQDKFFVAKTGEAKPIKITPVHGRRFLR